MAACTRVGTRLPRAWPQQRRHSLHLGEATVLEPLCATVTANLVVLVARETNVVQLKARPHRLTWVVRTTHVYRRGVCGWRLLHRHAAPVVESRSAEETFAAFK